MENFKIIIPLESDEERKVLKRIAENAEGIELSDVETKNIDGTDVAVFLGQVEQMIEFAGSLASIYALIATRRVQIVDNKNVIKSNVRFKDLITYLKNFVK